MPLNAALSGMVNAGKGKGLLPDLSFPDSFEKLALSIDKLNRTILSVILVPVKIENPGP